jgi:cytochrome c-type biogenesis protein
MLDVSYPVAFGAGVLSFFAPCVAPLLPAYIAYVTGITLKNIQDDGLKPYRKKIMYNGVLYILGFSLVFVALGVAASGLGASLRKYDDLIQKAGGLIIILFGLEFAGFLNIKLLAKQRQIQIPEKVQKLGPARSFVIGLIFAATWTPCIGAVLGTILALAATSGQVFKGASLLFVYSLGISVPFIIVSMSLSYAPKYLKVVTKNAGKISKIAGVLMIILGVLLLTNTYRYLNSYLFQLAFSLGYQVR